MFYILITDVIYAVKDYRGPCVGLDDANFSAYLTFFKKNVSLRHLDLEIRHSPVISCVQILDCLMESKVLQTLLLDGSPITHKDGINKADSLVKFLNQVKTLKKLSLKSCCIEGDTRRY